MAGAFRRWNSRRRSPSMRALREAGPPLRWIVAAIPLALAVVVVLYVAGVENRALLVAIPFVAFVLVCFIDRDGWRIRMAMAEVAGAPARAVAMGQDPDRRDVRRRLARRAPRCPGGRPGVDAGHAGEARGGARARHIRVRRNATGRPEPGAHADPVRGRRTRRSLGQARRWQPSMPRPRRLPLRPTNAATSGCRWPGRSRGSGSVAGSRGATISRTAFATSGPYQVSRRYQAFHAIQQFALPIAYVGALLIVWGLGLADALLRG